MKQWIMILAILLVSFSVAMAAGGAGSASTGTTSTSTSTTTTGGSTGTVAGSTANSVGTLDPNTFSGTTTTTGAPTGTLGSATIAPTTTAPTRTTGITNTGIANTATTTNLAGTISATDLNSMFNQFVAANQLGNLSTIQLNNLFTQFRGVLLSPTSNGLITNPLTGQRINAFANPFNTGLNVRGTINGTAVPSATGNLTVFPNGEFPNGVALNVNFPLNVPTGTSGTAVLSNPNTNLTRGAGSTGFTSTTAATASGGLRFPTLTLLSNGQIMIDRTNETFIANGSGSMVQTNVKGIVQRSNGTFTNIRKK